MFHHEKNAEGQTTLVTLSGATAETGQTKVLTPLHDAFADVPNAAGGVTITFSNVEGFEDDVVVPLCSGDGFLAVRQWLDANHTANQQAAAG